MPAAAASTPTSITTPPRRAGRPGRSRPPVPALVEVAETALQLDPTNPVVRYLLATPRTRGYIERRQAEVIFDGTGTVSGVACRSARPSAWWPPPSAAASGPVRRWRRGRCSCVTWPPADAPIHTGVVTRLAFRVERPRVCRKLPGPHPGRQAKAAVYAWWAMSRASLNLTGR